MAFASIIKQRESELNRPLTDEEINNISIYVENQDRLRREALPTFSETSSPTSSTSTSPLTISEIDTIDNIDQQLAVLRIKGASEKTIKSVVDSIAIANKKKYSNQFN